MAIDKKINSMFFLIELLIKGGKISSNDENISFSLGCSTRTLDRHLMEISSLSNSLIKVRKLGRYKCYELVWISTKFEKIIRNIPYVNNPVEDFLYIGPKQKAHLLASSEMIHFFNGYIQKHENFETILKHKDDGSIEFIFLYMNSIEILPFIKMWVPHLRVITPQCLKDELEDELKRYLYG